MPTSRFPGVGFKSLQTYMGHASITVTLDRYGRLLPGTGATAPPCSTSSHDTELAGSTPFS